MPTKFSLLSSDKQLDATYSLAMRIEELRKRMTRVDIHDPFVNIVTPDPDPAHAGRTLGDTSDLLRMYMVLTEEEIRESVRFYKTYGQDYDLQNLEWSQELLENSCESDLREKVMERMQAIPEIERGGPTFFHIMCAVLTSTSEDAVRSLTEKIQNMKLSDFQGEDVDKAVSQLRGAIARLTIIEKIPADINQQLIEVFQTSSVPDFNLVFHTLGETIRLNISNRTFEPDDILRQAERAYKDFYEAGKWTNAGKPESAFKAGAFVKCWRCHEEGHISRECPNKGKRGGGRGGRNNNGRGRGGGRGNRGGGRGGGRGNYGGGRWNRGGRGGRGRNHNHNNNNSTGNELSIHSWTTCPGRNQPNQQLIHNVICGWCDDCGIWNPDHCTESHDHSRQYSFVPQMMATTGGPRGLIGASVGQSVAGTQASSLTTPSGSSRSTASRMVTFADAMFRGTAPLRQPTEESKDEDDDKADQSVPCWRV